ncbi:hypothetical protein FNV43_RR21256 [Rhamnella rubrinervis]|uniref:Bidirectional sugar transporter SWEET n=1 Tax=Rhamnella rubrinervis TaxID=2594499 RepID=A0A8K0E2C5_9ROSA|nr:hypothetical protein FNV43_RR21256 [Rhamnella rubrinervis]
MAIFATHNIGVLIFGLLGNITSFVVFLAPVPTFLRVFRKKSTEGFQSVPYLVALFSGMMWLYYASLKTDETLLITINSFGCVIETIYIAIYITYAPKQARDTTTVELWGFCLILLLSHFLTKGPNRIKVLGWLNVSIAVSVFAAPLSIIRVVIRTKSVEFMPFPLSFFLTLSAVMWLFYGIFLKDIYVALPNILGFIFGVLQMILYVVFKNSKTVIEEQKLPEHKAAQVDEKLSSTGVTAEVQIICATEEAASNIDENGTVHHNSHGHVTNHHHEKSMEDCLKIEGPPALICEV